MRLKDSARLLVLVAAIMGGTSAHATSLIDEGREHFMARRFYAAEDCFNRASQADPQNQLIRFYLGQTLEHLYDEKAAKVAYTDCFRINPFNEQGSAAKKALLQLNGRIEERAHQATDTPDVTRKTVEMINRQSGEMQANYIRWGNTTSQRAISNGNRIASRNGYFEPMTLAGVRGGSRLYDYTGMEDWSSRGQIRTSWIRADAQVQALRHQSASVRSARELAATAANLEALIAEKKRPGEAKLRALGTQLYVRYYGSEDHDAPTPPQDPLIELKATELRLSSLPPIRTETSANVSLAQSVGSMLRSKHY
jgi:tetratricopeptide (TPR) repeat protein